MEACARASESATAPSRAAFVEEIPPGAAWSKRIAAGRDLRLEATAPGANAAMLIFNLTVPTERLNLPDTLKSQESACVRPPMVLMDGMGHALMTVTGSSLDWHDALCGHGRQAAIVAALGETSYAAERNHWRRSGREGLLREMWKWNLDNRDLHQTVNLFSKAAPAGDERGTLAFVAGHAAAGDWISLRADLDVLVVISTAPHPLDPLPAWEPSGLLVRIAEAAVAAPDPARGWRAQSARALEESERLLA